MARLKDVVVDCAHPYALATFWAAALDGYEMRPYNDEEIARLRERGIDRVEDDPSVFVDATDGAGANICFQRVPEPKTVKNRLHFDLKSADRAGEVVRLCGLGATVFAAYGEPGDGWTVLRDPAGNEFCVFDSRAEPTT
jgi:hypothetical protein